MRPCRPPFGASMSCERREGDERVRGSDVARAASLGESATSVIGYQQHQHLNCYAGHGGSALGPNDGLQAGVNSVDECGKAADSHGGVCFVYFWKYNQCFLRTECNTWACEEGKQGEESYDFDTFLPGPEDAECLIEHGQGKWRPYWCEPPLAIAL